MNLRKILWLDTETTGLKAWEHDIIQLAALVEIDGEVVDEINMQFRPDLPENIQEQALKINRLTKEDIMKYPKAKGQVDKLLKKLDKYVDPYNKMDKFVLAGYCVDFDKDFLVNLLKRNADSYGFGSRFNYRFLDVYMLAMLYDNLGLLPPEIDNHKLGTLCSVYGVKLGIDEAHDAMNDIKATRELFEKMTGILLKAEANAKRVEQLEGAVTKLKGGLLKLKNERG